MHYYNGQAAAKRIGISYKTLLRWIEKGKIRSEDLVAELSDRWQKTRAAMDRPMARIPSQDSHIGP